MNCYLPATREECRNGPRPCGLLSCQHHFWWLHVDDPNPKYLARRILSKHTDEEIIRKFVIEPAYSCFLDWYEENVQATLVEVAELAGFSKQRTDQIQKKAIAKIIQYPRIQGKLVEYEPLLWEREEWRDCKSHLRDFLRIAWRYEIGKR